MTNLDVHFSSLSEHWLTPPEYVEAALNVFGGTIDLDPCADILCLDNVPATIKFTVLDDGLSRPWFGNVWMNPPYGSAVSKWVKYAIMQHMTNDTNIIALLPSRTDTKFFQPLINIYPICFVRGRIKFKNVHLPSYRSDGNYKVSPAPFPSAVVLIGDKSLYKKFNAEFSRFGRIVEGL